MSKAILMGPFVGEFYWEAGRFAPLLPKMVYKTRKDQDIKYIVLTREERFDLYGCNADILVPLRIDGDYRKLRPNCFRLDGLPLIKYNEIAEKFKRKYNTKFKIINHIYPKIDKKNFLNKNQYNKKEMMFKFNPRRENYHLVDSYLPKDKPIVTLAPRYRNGFKRNWGRWDDFYDILANDELNEKFNFVICGKRGEYVPDKKNRFYDMNKINLGENSSLVGLLLVILERSIFTFGSQSAIPNISLLYGVEVLEFGCQKTFHTRTYNVMNTPITFIVNPKYNIEPQEIFKKLKKILMKKYNKEIDNGKRMDANELNKGQYVNSSA